MSPMTSNKFSSKSLMLGALLCSLSTPAWPQGADKQKAFASPQAAVDSLMAAVQSGNANAIIEVLGPEGRSLAISGDPVADQATRARFAGAYSEGHELKQESAERVILVVGKDEFPFPIPIFSDGGSWRFDTAAGVEEILNRRIGENELGAIAVVRTIIEAQHEYSHSDRDGKGVQYARRILSSEGTTDGLYWPASSEDDISPLGPLVADARAEGYRRGKASGPQPYHGYIYKVLTRQGKNASGGEADFVVKGRMIGGFAVVAAPAEYGNSGVMTFIANHDGVIYQKDLGPNSARIAAQMNSYNPDTTWSAVQEN